MAGTASRIWTTWLMLNYPRLGISAHQGRQRSMALLSVGRCPLARVATIKNGGSPDPVCIRIGLSCGAWRPKDYWHRNDTMLRGFVIATCLLSMVGCVPDLRPDFFCAPDLTVPYAESPSQLVTPQIKTTVDAYVSLSGKWRADWTCPPASGESGSIDIVIQTSTPDEMRMIVGPDTKQPGYDCHNAGTVLADGQITLDGPVVGDISGKTASLQAELSDVTVAHFSLEGAVGSPFPSVDGKLVVEADVPTYAVVIFSSLPEKDSNGVTSQNGYSCGFSLVEKL